MVLAILERGHKVIATSRARSLPKLAELKERGAEVLELDVVAPLTQLQEIAKKSVGIYGKIDVVVNNAGNVAFGALEENTYASPLVGAYTGKLICDLIAPRKRSTNSIQTFLEESTWLERFCRICVLGRLEQLPGSDPSRATGW